MTCLKSLKRGVVSDDGVQYCNRRAECKRQIAAWNLLPDYSTIRIRRDKTSDPRLLPYNLNLRANGNRDLPTNLGINCHTTQNPRNVTIKRELTQCHAVNTVSVRVKITQFLSRFYRRSFVPEKLPTSRASSERNVLQRFPQKENQLLVCGMLDQMF